MAAARVLLASAWLTTGATGFAVAPPPSRSTVVLRSSSWDEGSLSGSDTGAIEQIEFKIFPDGRVEETVRGVKGNNCHKVTEKINESLGVVVDSSPTTEMFEQEVVINQEITLKDGSDWEGSSSW